MSRLVAKSPDDADDARSKSTVAARPKRVSEDLDSSFKSGKMAAILKVPAGAQVGDALCFLTHLGLFTMPFTAEAEAAMTSERDLNVDVPVTAQQRQEEKKKEKQYEGYRAVVHCKWVCIERNGEYLTPAKRPVPTSPTDDEKYAEVMEHPSKDLPVAMLRDASSRDNSPYNARSLSAGLARMAVAAGLAAVPDTD